MPPPAQYPLLWPQGQNIGQEEYGIGSPLDCKHATVEQATMETWCGRARTATRNRHFSHKLGSPYLPGQRRSSGNGWKNMSPPPCDEEPRVDGDGIGLHAGGCWNRPGSMTSPGTRQRNFNASPLSYTSQRETEDRHHTYSGSEAPLLASQASATPLCVPRRHAGICKWEGNPGNP